MTKTVFIIGIDEIQFLRIICKKCSWAMQMPLGEHVGNLNIHQCPSCQERLPVEDIRKGILQAVKSLQDNLKNDPNFRNARIEIEVETHR